MPPSEFSPTSGDWSKLGIPNLAHMTNISNKKLLKATKYLGKTNRIGRGVARVNNEGYYLTRVNDCHL